MGQKHVVIVGAGAGGLSTAARLAHRGVRVTVLEQNGTVGGRNRRQSVNGCQFDGGPTLLMMLDPFRKLFADLGERFEERVPITLCNPSYRVFYADGSRIDATIDQNEMTERIRALCGDRDAEQFKPFLAELRELYEASIPNFVRKNYGSLRDFAGPRQLGLVTKHHMLSNLAKRVEKRFSDPRLRMLFSFQTMYLGLSPYDAPWVYATLAYMEFGEGIWYPSGGLSRITEEIASLAQERGAEIRLGARVATINPGRVTLDNGEEIAADAVVSNADLTYTNRELVGKPDRRKLRFSCSAHVMYIDYEGELENLQHHNVLFGSDFRGNLDSLFHSLKTPDDPAFYVCLAKRTDPTVAPEGHHSLFILVPVPNLDCAMSDADQARLEDTVFARLTKESGFDPSKIRGVARCGPKEWHEQLNLDRGAAFGLSHDLFQSAFMRPQNVRSDVPGLYYVGASTVPGNGLPMVLISAELVEQRLICDGVLDQ